MRDGGEYEGKEEDDGDERRKQINSHSETSSKSSVPFGLPLAHLWNFNPPP
jgi:hypothetical protein